MNEQETRLDDLSSALSYRNLSPEEAEEAVDLLFDVRARLRRLSELEQENSDLIRWYSVSSGMTEEAIRKALSEAGGAE